MERHFPRTVLSNDQHWPFCPGPGRLICLDWCSASSSFLIACGDAKRAAAVLIIPRQRHSAKYNTASLGERTIDPSAVNVQKPESFRGVPGNRVLGSVVVPQTRAHGDCRPIHDLFRANEYSVQLDGNCFDVVDDLFVMAGGCTSGADGFTPPNPHRKTRFCARTLIASPLNMQASAEQEQRNSIFRAANSHEYFEEAVASSTAPLLIGDWLLRLPRRFHQMSGPVNASNGRLRLIPDARIRVGSPPMSPV